MKSSFFERVGAYFIDIIIVSIIVSLIGYSLPNNESTVEKQLSELTTKYVSGEVTSSEYLDSYSVLLYQNEKDNMLKNGIGLVLTIAYFIIFQYMNEGQTIGKKLLHIKVVDNKTKKCTNMLKGLLRSIIVLGIASSSLNLILLNFTNKRVFMISYSIIAMLESIFTLVSIVFVLYRKDGRGLHDMMAGTTVIKEGR